MRIFGEAEFWAGAVKVVVLTVLIVTCFIIVVGGSPSHDVIGFRYWNNPGTFAEYLLTGPKGRFLGWWACMIQACFAFTGVEVVGMTFGETPNPRKNIPRAIKQTFFRITVFYLVSILILGMAVPYNSSELLGATSASTSAGQSTTMLCGFDMLTMIQSCLALCCCHQARRYSWISRCDQRNPTGLHTQCSKFRFVFSMLLFQ